VEWHNTRLIRENVGEEIIKTTGAVVMGRRAYDTAEGDFTDYEFQVPIFVLLMKVCDYSILQAPGKLSWKRAG